MSKSNQNTNRIPSATPSDNYDLFQELFSPKESTDQLSNLLNVWDVIPKYGVSKYIQNRLRTNDTHELPNYTQEFTTQNGDKCTLEIVPARIEVDGVKKDFYPGELEELIEAIIRKFFLQQQYAIHMDSVGESWCKFSLNMISDELKKYNKSRSFKEIKHALEIMQRCQLHVTINQKQAYRGGIFLESLISDRENYIHNYDTLSAVRFSSLVSTAIDNLEYRQYNHEKTMHLNMQLSRWLFKRLSLNFLNAGFNAPPYAILFSEIDRDCGMLHHSEMRRRYGMVRKALDELIKSNLMQSYTENIIYRGQKIHDIEFFITANRRFISEMKAANARLKTHKERIAH